jgi:hypothetical protein
MPSTSVVKLRWTNTLELVEPLAVADALPVVVQPPVDEYVEFVE